MSIGPVQFSSPGVERPAPEKTVRGAPPPLSANPEISPKAEIVHIQNNPIRPLIPEHEVEVQWDTPADHIMVYRVLDKQSGALVLQVPSAEVLNEMIQTQELLQRIASREEISFSAASAATTTGK
jgi:hypothetical protein